MTSESRSSHNACRTLLPPPCGALSIMSAPQRGVIVPATPNLMAAGRSPRAQRLTVRWRAAHWALCRRHGDALRSMDRTASGNASRFFTPYSRQIFLIARARSPLDFEIARVSLRCSGESVAPDGSRQANRSLRVRRNV